MRPTLILAIFFIGSLANAVPYHCKVEFHKESAETKTGALICGEFKFDPDEKTSKHQVFDKCQNLALDFRSFQTPLGLNYVIELTRDGSNETTRFASRFFPINFQIEQATTRTEKGHRLDDTYFADCETTAVPVQASAATPAHQNENHGMWSQDFECKRDADCAKKGPEYRCVPHDFICAPPNQKCTGFTCEKPKAKK